jgi:hypothetical protein
MHSLTKFARLGVAALILCAWACQVKLTPVGKPGPCSKRVSLTGAQTLRLPSKLTGKGSRRRREEGAVVRARAGIRPR